MANRRMFSLDVIDTDLFLEMPATSQNLYFHLGMRADDDGFVSSPRKITKAVNCGMDDLNVLIAKGFIIPFDDGVIVIRHWKQNNYIQADRYKPTLYQEDKAVLVERNGVYDLDTECIQDVSKMDTECIQDGYNLYPQDRIGKDRLGKDRGEGGEEAPDPTPYQEVVDLYNSICKSYPTVKSLSDKRKKSIRARFNSGYTLENFKAVFEAAERSDFLKGKNDRDWSATFDWMIADANMAKILDGNYENRKGDKDGGDVSSGESVADYYKRLLNG